MRGRTAFAVLMEQGLGKTKVVLDDAARLFPEKIDGLLIVAPNGVHTNWVRVEIPKHLSVPYISFEHRSLKSKTKRYEKEARAITDRNRDGWSPGKKLRVFAVNVDALSSSGGATALARKFLDSGRMMMIVDESTRIKNPGASRTKRAVALGRWAVCRRILTGTPVTQSPFDLYSQFLFLGPELLGFSSFYSFKHFYGTWKKRLSVAGDGRKWEYEELLSYCNLDALRRSVAPHSFRRTKAECLDLPKKIRKIVYVDLSPEQARLYAAMENEGIAEFEDFTSLAPLQITRLLRCQQILGGRLPGEEGAVRLPGENPRMRVLLDVVEDHPGKMIVWARFREEIAEISAELSQLGGVVGLHGGVAGHDRAESVERFQTDPKVRFLVGQQASGIGVTLTAAETVVYYSNDFSYEHRYQSEDRCHRIGLNHPVVYIDLVARDTVDEKIQSVHARALETAREIVDHEEMRRKSSDNPNL
jgi:SNF2 family DNA or RNA helicase